MKKRDTLLLFALILVLNTSIAQIFVKHDATGANDGTTWDNAYTDLTDALNTATVGTQVWVASGVYKPGSGNADSTSFFRFLNDIQLYGGFAGTETTLAERDFANNQTILSGDHNDDDIADNFVDNRSDNSEHVMWLTDTITNATLIDGFTFTHGDTQPGSGAGDNRRGGGLFTYGAPTIRNCTFSQNYGYFGGGLYPRGSASDGIIIENCIFDKNFSNAGGGIYTSSPTLSVIDCSFSGNETDGSNGAGFYISSRQGVLVSGCSFTENKTTDNRGAGIYVFHSPGTIENCTFTDNSSLGSSGAGIMIRDDSDESPFTIDIVDCTFTRNIGNFGGAFGCYDELSTANLLRCTFRENTSTNLGGATTNGFGGTTNFTDCNFENNNAVFGGAVFNQNNGSNVTMTGCLLNLNSSSARGGAIHFIGDGDPALDSIPIPLLTIISSRIEGNTATEQGGGLNISNANLHIENSIIHNNLTSNIDGVGGGISLNASDTLHTVFTILNSTIADNFSALGSGIANWKGGVEGTSQLTLQNTILANDIGADYQIEDGNPVAISAGGNLSSDNTMNDFLVGMNDIIESDPLFIDKFSLDYKLQDGSPAIDQGIETGAPTTDLEGNPRVGAVDIGCYENQSVSSTNELKRFGALQIFPNPVAESANIDFTAEWTGAIKISITDQMGKLVFVENFIKSNERFTTKIPTARLPLGVYNVYLSNGTLFNIERFVK